MGNDGLNFESFYVYLFFFLKRFVDVDLILIIKYMCFV